MTFQEDRIIQRLNDYPGQIEHFRTEAGSLNTYWNLENEKLLARQAAFLSPEAPGYPAGTFTMYCASYADLEDSVINIAPTRELRRTGMKRTVSLCVLTTAFFLLMALTIFRTRLLSPEVSPGQGRRMASQRCKVLQVLAGTVLVLCVVMIQMLSAVNQSAESAASSAAFLREILSGETSRTEVISEGFDTIGRQRVNSAAQFLSDHPEMAGMDTLKELDEIMGGVGMRICSLDGTVTLSDELFRANTKLDTLPDERSRVYRAPITDESGRQYSRRKGVNLCV